MGRGRPRLDDRQKLENKLARLQEQVAEIMKQLSEDAPESVVEEQTESVR